MKYNPIEVESKWQKYWFENQTFAAKNNSEIRGEAELSVAKPKYYVLDMFPYPSGAGLHVGHPLGYIASDIYARFKRHKGFNVLHPQGYDSFGLPAEQYAIQTGQHPDKTTKENIARYREQLDKIGFSFDWSREVRTSNADYYKHTQWIFIQLFNSWYNKNSDKAEDISTLISIFEKDGNAPETSGLNAVCDDEIQKFSASQWNSFSSDQQQKILLKYRLTYLAETEVNWCPGLGTVLANDEIINGVSERGGHTVIRKKMTQWSMRISAYAERLLQGLNDIDWSESIKESQRNWIGKSVGAMVSFAIKPHPQPLSSVEGSIVPESGFMTANPEIAKQLVSNARENRKNSTEAEDTLWQEVRNSKLGFKIRRQHYVGNFIADFICLEKRLIIEVDGGYHNTNEQIELDEERTLELEQKYLFKVIRFTNNEVINDISNVLLKIKDELNLRNSFKTIELAPLSSGEGLGVRFIDVFTTRPDTLFGVTFMTLAPEHPLVQEITTSDNLEKVNDYIFASSKRSERERMADVKTISGVFTGAYAEHPFSKEPIPVWIGDYVLAGYGTGAVMAVPCGDERDYAFANFFKDNPDTSGGMPEIKNIFKNIDISKEAYTSKEGFVLNNSDFLNGLNYKEATQKVIEELEKINQGKGKINYRLRDAVFSRQRYWGEPFPVYYVNGLPQMIDKKYLPIALPEVENYLPTEDGLPPLGNAKAWHWDTNKNEIVSVEDAANPPSGVWGLELNTMPGWAGSSWYWMRYMDAHNTDEFSSKAALDYWQNVDLYIGGSEHATGHLLYSRFWNKFLKDKGFAPTEEPFKKLINQGMILGMSAFVYRLEGTTIYVSKNKIAEQKVQPIHVDVSLVNTSDELDIEAFKNSRSEYKDADFILENGELFISGSFPSGRSGGAYIVGREIEKMSKSKYNVVTPDSICNEYGADTLRLYEMFLGPLEQSKPWNTAGISGVFGFLKKLWRLYNDDTTGWVVTNNEPSKESLKSLHKTIKKVNEDIENFSFNTSVSQFMICVNELTAQNCHDRAILEPLAVLISPYAPHIAEELWLQLGHSESISTVDFPIVNEKYLVESSKEYPVSFNGKMRFTIELSLDLSVAEIQEIIMKDERTIKQLEGRTPNKVIIVPGKVINLVG
jgi:leucyl-tRNA synthetase